MTKILIICNSIKGLYSFRRELVQSLVQGKYEVYISHPNHMSALDGYFTDLGCSIIHIPFVSRSTNLFKDIVLLFKYSILFLKIKPSIVLSYTIKPNIYGGIVCRIFNIIQIANITGLGDAIENGGKLQKFLLVLYKFAVNKAFVVFFQNKSNMIFCNKRGIALQNSYLIPGSGVNINYHTPKLYPENGVIKFLFIARIIKSKGVEEYLYAAKKIKEKYKYVEFQILGSCEDNYKQIIDEFTRKKIIKYFGSTHDVRPYIWDAHCTVLPSYHEGMSNVNLESQANGRPVITTNVPGCKETIINNRTGFLVAPKNKEDLENKIEQFINLPYSEKVIMGRNARNWVVNNFNRQIVIDAYLNYIKKCHNV